VTFNLKVEEEFYGISFIWTILKRLLPDSIQNNIRGMRGENSRMGAVFDVSVADAERVEECYK